MKKIGIIGLGLIGGSLARAITSRCDETEIVVLGRNEEPLKKALSDGVITSYTTKVDETFNNCDIIFICTPVNKICGFVELLQPYINENTIITDVGSTKNEIYKKLKQFENINFIGGHPMAGSEKTGYSASKEYLFENAYYILTPLPNVSLEKINSFKTLVKQLGAIPIIMEPVLHDYSVAAISHVPHVIASALVNMVNELDDDSCTMHTLAAGGFNDITRIASSSPDMWYSICLENKEEILKVISSFEQNILNFKKLLSKNDEVNIKNYFSNAKDYRDGFEKKSSGGFLKSYQVFVDVVDRPGSIATIATLLSVNNINIKNIGIVNNREYENGIMQIVLDKEESMLKCIELLIEMNFLVYPK